MPSHQQGSEQPDRLFGLGLAGIATVFYAATSVCAKTLGTLSKPAEGVQLFLVQVVPSRDCTAHLLPAQKTISHNMQQTV